MSAPAPQDFESSLARLELLVENMEGGKLTLDQMIAAFEEGSALVQTCTKRLNEVEQKIEKLVKREGVIRKEPLDAESEETP